MLEIKLDNRTSIPLRGKSLLILPMVSRSRNVINNGRDNYDAIMIVAGVDRTVNIHLDRTAIIIIETGGRTTVNVTGTTALNTSQVVFIAEVDNKVNGLLTQNIDRTVNIHFDRTAILIIETGGRTTVNVTGTTALNTSQVVFIAEVDNKVNGLLTQNRGKIISARREEFDLASITDFERIEIG